MFDLARTSPRVERLLPQWQLDSLLGAAVPQLLADDTLLFSNRIAQPLIVAATLAAWEALSEALPAPSLVAGYSIGELASYAVAGSLSAKQAIDLAAARARLMDACSRATGQQGLLAISGIGTNAIGDLLHRHAMHIAIETGADSCIAGGLLASIIAIGPAIMQRGGRISTLPVDIASHTPYLSAAVPDFLAELKQHPFIDPSVPVLSGISAEIVSCKEQAVATLARQIAERIRWADCMDACAESGITVALELGPGAALSHMLHARHPHIECRSIADFRSLQGIAGWLGHYFE